MKNKQQGRQSKSSFKAFLGANYYTKMFFVGQPWWLTFFQGFFARGHWISNLNPEIGRGYEIIITFERTLLDQNIGTVAWWQRAYVTWQISISSVTDELWLWNWTAGSPLGKESIAYFLSVAVNVITTWSCVFHKLQSLEPDLDNCKCFSWRTILLTIAHP